MALGFGRKKKAPTDGDEVVSASVTKGGKGEATRKRKPQEMLSSVIKESTEGAAVALLRANKNFLINDGATGVILLLDATKIGGLSQKQRGDEAKGSIIELITADHIQTLATAEMLEEDVFGIIPTADTIERMDEYEILVNAPYTWGTVQLSDFEIAEGGPATFMKAKRVSDGVDDIHEAMGRQAAAFVPPAPTQVMPAVADDEVVFDDEDEDDELPAPVPPSVDEPAPFDDDEIVYDDEDDEGEEDADGEEDVFDPDAYDNEPDEDERVVHDDRVVTEEEVRSTIARRYLSGDLDLEVDLDDFEAYLGTDEPLVLFSTEAEADDWLGNQIAQMAKQANVELEQFHQSRIAELRQQYLKLMSMHVENIVAELDPEDRNGIYGKAKQAALARHRDRAEKMDAHVSELKRDLTDRFEKEAEERAQAAAHEARMRYKERNRPRLERDLSDVSAAVAAQSDARLTLDQEQILEERRNEAGKRLDLGKNKTLETLAQRHRELVAEERELFSRHSARMQSFLDDNRKEDIARTQALQAQLARQDEVQAAHDDYTARMDAAAAEHAAAISRLTGEMEQARAEYENKLAAAQATWQANLEQEKANTQAAQTRAEGLAESLKTIDEKKDREYAERMESLRADVRRADEQADRAVQVQSRGTRLLAVLGLVMAAFALAVGILIGLLMPKAAPTQPVAPAPATVTQTVQPPASQPTVTVTAQSQPTQTAPTTQAPATTSATPSR